MPNISSLSVKLELTKYLDESWLVFDENTFQIISITCFHIKDSIKKSQASFGHYMHVWVNSFAAGGYFGQNEFIWKTLENDWNYPGILVLIW